MLIIEVMKVSFEGALAHPLSIMHVPIIEGIFQLYQLKLLKMMVQLFFAFSDEQKLSNGLIFLQLYTVFSMRAMLEIAVARAMSLWYFSVDGESSTERSIGAIVGAHTKSFGTACCAGLVQFIVNQIAGFYRKIKKRYDSLKWSVHNLLPKLALFFLVWMVGWIAVRLEVFTGYTVIFAGIYGTGYVESAKKSAAINDDQIGLGQPSLPHPDGPHMTAPPQPATVPTMRGPSMVPRDDLAAVKKVAMRPPLNEFCKACMSV